MVEERFPHAETLPCVPETLFFMIKGKDNKINWTKCRKYLYVTWSFSDLKSTQEVLIQGYATQSWCGAEAFHEGPNDCMRLPETVTSLANLCGHWRLHGGCGFSCNASGSRGLTLTLNLIVAVKMHNRHYFLQQISNAKYLLKGDV